MSSLVKSMLKHKQEHLVHKRILRKFAKFQTISDERSALTQLNEQNLHFKGGPVDKSYTRKHRRDSNGKKIINTLNIK